VGIPARARSAEVRALLDRFCSWAAARPDVAAVGLAGSEARGEARAGSDVDLVVLTDEPESYLPAAWARDALPDGAEDLGARRWGVLLERRFVLPGGVEVDVGLAPPRWAAVPVDPGTARVVGDGFVVLLDPSGLLAGLVETVAAGS
jgi:predicted nucleotidyltransferase